AAKAEVALASLWRLCQKEVWKVKRWIKPVFSDQQKVDRVGFILSHTHRRGGGRVFVDNLYDWVHVDEKWFPQRWERPSPQTPTGTKFLVVFLAAVARPRKMSNGVWLDGKFGIWPIVDTKVAQRTRKHRPEGTKVLVPAMVDGERYKKLMIEAVIPTIKACMP
ncbi:unnamed protein product, partial [Discosporangium mesarthrocarpum]